MYLKKLSALPVNRRRTINHKLRNFVLEFYDSDMYCAEVSYDLEEYCSNHSLHNGLIKAVQSLDLQDAVKVIARNGSIYLVRI